MRDLLDLLERRARVLREQRPADDVGRAALHRHHGLVRIGLDRADEHLDLLRRARGTFGQLLDLVGDDGEPAAGLSGPRRLDRRVERQDVRLLGDLLDELDDVADLLRALAEALDALARVLNRFADRVHAGDRAPYGLAALVRDLDRVACDVGAALGVAGDFFDRDRHARHRLRRRGGLFCLSLRRAYEVARRAFVCFDAASTRIDESLIVVTSSRSASIA